MSQTIAAEAPTTHAQLLDWVGEIAELTQPDSVYWWTARLRSTTASPRP